MNWVICWRLWEIKVLLKTAMFASSHLVMLNCSTCNSNISFTPHFTTKQYFFFCPQLEIEPSRWARLQRMAEIQDRHQFVGFSIALLIKVKEAEHNRELVQCTWRAWYSLIWLAEMLENQQNVYTPAGGHSWIEFSRKTMGVSRPI